MHKGPLRWIKSVSLFRWKRGVGQLVSLFHETGRFSEACFAKQWTRPALCKTEKRPEALVDKSLVLKTEWNRPPIFLLDRSDHRSNITWNETHCRRIWVWPHFLSQCPLNTCLYTKGCTVRHGGLPDAARHGLVHQCPTHMRHPSLAHLLTMRRDQWWASYFHKVTALLYLSYWWK